MVYPSRAAWLTLREHIGLTFATIWIFVWFALHIFLVFYVVYFICLSLFCILCSMLLVSLDCPLCIARSVFFNVYMHLRTFHIPDNLKISKKSLNSHTVWVSLFWGQYFSLWCYMYSGPILYDHHFWDKKKRPYKNRRGRWWEEANKRGTSVLTNGFF